MKKFFNNLFAPSKKNKKKSSNKQKFTNDQIPIQKQNNKNSSQPLISNPNEIIQLKLRSKHSKLSKSDFNLDPCKQPLLVTIETEDIDNDDLRQGLDLVLVIDISTSMRGEKIKLVREILMFILDELEPRDRVCMVKFANFSQQICGFRSMTNENKKFLKDLVDKEIRVVGSTDIKKAMEVAYDAMLSRETQNDSTAVFLLSDGEDTCGNSMMDIKKVMEERHKMMQKRGFSYQTHSFGYGSDHDEKVLSMISDTTLGNFYYIKTNKHVDECFIDCFGI